MTNICNHCGAVIPEGKTVCPTCGAPAANAPTDADKKFWERDDLQPIEKDSEAATLSPKQGATIPPLPPESNDGATPPPLPNQSSPLHRKKFNLAVVFAIISVAIIILLIAIFVIRNTSAKVDIQKTEQSEQPQIVTEEITGDQMDSLMQASMAELQQTDSIMQAMMEQMMSGDPMTGIPEDFFNEGSNHQPSNNAPHKSNTKKGVLQLAGRIGQQDIVLVLDTKDAQNIKGSGSFVVKGKETEKLHALGIGDGSDLTITVYNTKNEPLGTLSGTFNGYFYQGTYVQDGKETSFQMTAE